MGYGDSEGLRSQRQADITLPNTFLRPARAAPVETPLHALKLPDPTPLLRNLWDAATQRGCGVSARPAACIAPDALSITAQHRLWCTHAARHHCVTITASPWRHRHRTVTTTGPSPSRPQRHCHRNTITTAPSPFRRHHGVTATVTSFILGGKLPTLTLVSSSPRRHRHRAVTITASPQRHHHWLHPRWEALHAAPRRHRDVTVAAR